MHTYLQLTVKGTQCPVACQDMLSLCALLVHCVQVRVRVAGCVLSRRLRSDSVCVHVRGAIVGTSALQAPTTSVFRTVV